MQNFTPGAKLFARENGISLESVDIKGTGFKGSVTEADLLKCLDSQGKVFSAEKNRAIATPLARKMANTVGISLEEMAKPGRKIMAADVEAVMAPQNVVSPKMEDGIQEPADAPKVPYSGVRKIIGERLSHSNSTAPHVYFTQKVNMDELLELRKSVNEQKSLKLSVTDYIAKAVIQTLQKYPDVNVSLHNGYIEKYQSVNLGIAVAAPLGLIVPVVKHAEQLSIREISQCSSKLIEKARNGKLTQDEYTGGTFTISNLGMFGIENFTAIINPPESAILAVSATKDEPVVVQGGDGIKMIAIKPMMNICLSVDHRLIDGMLAAGFVTEVKNILEHPIGLLMD